MPPTIHQDQAHGLQGNSHALACGTLRRWCFGVVGYLESGAGFLSEERNADPLRYL